MPSGSETVNHRAARKQLGRYEIVKPIGSGGMGTVFLAHDKMLGREVAVKTCHPQPGTVGEEFIARFLNEARCIAGLKHPNIVPVFDMGVDEETPFMVMELVQGASLKDRLEPGPLSPQEVRIVGIQIANALAAAHRADVLHRDLKPANVLEAEPGVWKLVDFGIARTPNSSLTEVGTFLGTPGFSALETLESAHFSPASDVYGLAATLYLALTGELPHGDGTAVQVAMRAHQGPPTSVSARRPDAPPGLASAIDRALSTDPAVRPSAEEMAQLLAQGAQRPAAHAHAHAPVSAPPRRSRRLLWTGVGIAVGAAVTALIVTGGGVSPSTAEDQKSGAEIESTAAPNDRSETESSAKSRSKDKKDDGDTAATGAGAEKRSASLETPEEGVDPKALASALNKSQKQAILALGKLRKTYPQSAYIPYKQGMLQLDRMWWKDGYEALTVAIERNPAYREHEPLLRSAVRGFYSSSKAWRAHRFMVEVIGKPAIPYLEEFADAAKSSKIEGRARRALKELQ